MLDVAIIGGGIAGCWLLRDLLAAGYDAALFEKTALGAGQTIASQGIIHGGLKYRLAGERDDLARQLAAAPETWRRAPGLGDCFAAPETIWLSQTRTLSLLARLLSRSRSHACPAALFPGFVEARAVAEPVVDVPAVLAHLTRGGRAYAATVGEILPSPTHVLLAVGDRQQMQHWTGARVCVSLAGAGNRGSTLRPLRMFMVRGVPVPFWGHCLAPGQKPRVTITTHHVHGDLVWYIGGALAEKAHSMEWASGLAFARSELRALFPWIAWNTLRLSAFDIMRAEPAGAVPIIEHGRHLTAWPRKLALAPALAADLLQRIQRLIQMLPGRMRPPLNLPFTEIDLPPAPIARCPWDHDNWPLRR